jgi:hypothetical protein
LRLERFRVLLAWLVSLALSVVAVAQTPIVVTSVQSGPHPAHTWIIARDVTPINVLHLPPPVANDRSNTARVSETGVPTARLAYPMLRVAPDRAAALRDELFLFFETPEGKPVENFPPAPAQPTRVVSIRAEWTGERWTTTPLARPASQPNLPAGRTVIAAAGNNSTMFALLAPGGLSNEHVAEPSLFALDAATWRSVPLPADAAIDASTLLVGIDGGLGLLERTSIGSRMWITRITTRDPGADVVGPPQPPPPGQSLAPSREFDAAWLQLALPELAAQDPALQAGYVNDQLVLVSRDGDAMRLFAAVLPTGTTITSKTPEVVRVEPTWRELGSLQEVGVDPILAADGSRGWAGVVFQRTLTDVEKRYNEAPFAMSALTLASGSLAAKGPISVVGPVAVSDMTFVAVSLAWMVGLVALVVIRPPFEDGSWMLPAGVSLAEPMRRFLAWSLDLIIVVIVGGLLVGKSPLDTLTASIGDLLGTRDGNAMMLAIIGTAVVACSLCEAAFGRTPGKMLANCQVIRLVKGADNATIIRNPSLAQALTRNLVKWIFPPAAFVIFRDGSQHRGEQFSRTAVIVPWVEVEEDEEE